MKRRNESSGVFCFFGLPPCLPRKIKLVNGLHLSMRFVKTQGTLATYIQIKTI